MYHRANCYNKIILNNEKNDVASQYETNDFNEIRR
jgi:hypothetical protein